MSAYYLAMRKGRLKALIFILLAVLSINVGEAARIAVGVGTSYGSNVVWIPGHWYHGYWVPGQYVEYAGQAPGPGYVWIEGGYYGGHWRNGYWHGGHGGYRGYGGHHHH